MRCCEWRWNVALTQCEHRHDRADMVRILANVGRANVNIKKPSSGDAPLHLAGELLTPWQSLCGQPQHRDDLLFVQRCSVWKGKMQAARCLVDECGADIAVKKNVRALGWGYTPVRMPHVSACLLIAGRCYPITSRSERWPSRGCSMARVQGLLGQCRIE